MGRHAVRAALDRDTVFRPTRRDIDPVTGEPTGNALWDRHEWQAHGACWLWCGRDDVEVTWIGPVRSSGMHAAIFACRACLYELDQRVLEANLRQDAAVPPTSGRSARS
ncbi:hypothetical protein HEP81_04410 [Streptomyces griseofuscus]|uniref:Uncharacterized protein n=1 Tax=Streptomyces griseofuscus TaxID=146922 RepID=A0A7H1Q307_9ACTN|nr:hypothetical protein HEP81_04410 [Streptomyces griseofuscus]BBC95416.1 hypothetical protein SRO_4240 [Streptomyces rochei]